MLSNFCLFEKIIFVDDPSLYADTGERTYSATTVRRQPTETNIRLVLITTFLTFQPFLRGYCNIDNLTNRTPKTPGRFHIGSKQHRRLVGVNTKIGFLK